MVNPHKTWDREENLNKLLSFLKQTKEADFGTLRKYLGVSAATLTTYLKQLEIEKKIEHFEKPGDRRKTWYRIGSREMVEVQLGRYEATQFIGSLNNPLYSLVEIGTTSVSIFAEWENVTDRAKTERMLKGWSKGIATVLRIKQPMGRFAIVVTKSKS